MSVEEFCFREAFTGKRVVRWVSRLDILYFFSGLWRAGGAGEGGEERLAARRAEPDIAGGLAGCRRSQGGWERRHLAGKGVGYFC